MPARCSLVILGSLLGFGSLHAQAPARPSASSSAPLTDTPELKALKDLRWRSIGPANQAGRIPMMVGIPGDRSTYYVGAAAGGLFKTSNGGVTFEPLFDDQENASIGDLAIAPSNHSILYLGTGEGNPRNSASVGDGAACRCRAFPQLASRRTRSRRSRSRRTR